MDVIQEVKKLGWPKDEYVVVGSGIMAALGIRQPKDIDFIVDPKLYARLKRQGWDERTLDDGRTVLNRGVMDAAVEWVDSGKRIFLSDIQKTVQAVDGVSFASLEFMRGWKSRARRPKDLADLELIDRYRRAA